MVKRFLIFIAIISSQYVSAQTDLSEVQNIDSLLMEENKPVILFFTADWCRYCNRMKDDFTAIEEDSNLLSEDFYFLAVNEEQRESITLFGETYRYVPRGIGVGDHEIASTFARADGGIVYPTLVILWKGKLIFQKHSYMPKKELVEMLNATLRLTHPE
jgi:thioredoxin-related protein